MALFHSSVSVSHDSVTVSQRAQCQDPETEGAKWNSNITNVNIHTCDMLKCLLLKTFFMASANFLKTSDPRLSDYLTEIRVRSAESAFSGTQKGG